MTRRPISDLLAEARASLDRVDPATAASLVEEDAGLLVDIRPVGLRERDGELPGACIVDRNQLEWRLDPASPHRLAVVDDTTYDRAVVLVCDEGFASSLAAATLQALGLERATDVIGGFQAWRAAGLPVTAPASNPAPTAVPG